MQKSTKLRPALVVILAALAACASTNSVSSRLDSSGLTVVTLNEVIVLARPTRHLAIAARDYIYMGPVEINRMGGLQHYLWLGMASTVDRTLARVAEPQAATLALVLDGTPMSLPLTNWDTELLDAPPYESSVPVYKSLGAPVSLDQLTRIAHAKSIEVYLVNDKGASADYAQWEGQWPQWTAFTDRHSSVPEEALRANSE